MAFVPYTLLKGIYLCRLNSEYWQDLQQAALIGDATAVGIAPSSCRFSYTDPTGQGISGRTVAIAANAKTQFNIGIGNFY
jgi:hypothetical protein